MKKNFISFIEVFGNWLIFTTVGLICVAMDQNIVASREVSIGLVLMVATLGKFVADKLRRECKKDIQKFETKEEMEIKD